MPLDVVDEADQVADLRVAWGDQTRLKCAYCTSFLPNEHTITCRRCQARYEALDDGTHRIVRPGQ